MSGAQKPVVLVADDDPDIRALIVLRLQRSGYEVLQAADGDEALALAVQKTPDVALLDVMMPKQSGYDVTRAIREHERTRQMPVILLTARAQEQDVAHGLAAGADEYVTKPFSPQELRSRVAAILERGRRAPEAPLPSHP